MYFSRHDIISRLRFTTPFRLFYHGLQESYHLDSPFLGQSIHIISSYTRLVQYIFTTKPIPINLLRTSQFAISQSPDLMLASLYIPLIFSLQALVADFAVIAKSLQRATPCLRRFLALVARSTAICAIAEHTLFETAKLTPQSCFAGS